MPNDSDTGFSAKHSPANTRKQTRTNTHKQTRNFIMYTGWEMKNGNTEIHNHKLSEGGREKT